MDVPTLRFTFWLCFIVVAHGLTGDEFYLAFMGLDSNELSDDKFRTATIFITNPGHTDTRVEVSYTDVQSATPQTLSLAGGASEEVTLSTAVILSGAAKHEACAVVTSGSPVLVQASLEYKDEQLSMAGYHALPVSSMTGDYIVATYCATHQCVFVVTSAEDDNAVRVNIRTDGAGSAQYSGTQYSDGQVFNEWLNKGESLQVTCEACDLTGTLVSASGKVTVVGGGDFTRYDTNRDYQDAVADVMLPVESLGRQYLLGSGHGDLYEIVKVVVLKAGDSFTYDGVQQAAATRDRQVYVMPTRAMSDVVSLESSSPVLVMEVMANMKTSTGNTDVSMTLALPVSQWTASYNVYLPSDQVSLTLSLVSDRGSASFTTSIDRSSQSTSSSNGVTTSSMNFAAGGALLTVSRETCGSCEFSGFLIHDKDWRTSVIPLLPSQLVLVTTAEAATTGATATTTETATIASTFARELATDSSPVIFTQTTSQPSSQATNQATTQANQSTDPAAHSSTFQTVNQSTYQADNQAASRSTNQADNQSANEATTQSTNQTFNQSPSQAATLSTNQTTTQSTNQTFNQFHNQAATLSTTQATTQSTNQTFNQSPNQAATLSTTQATTQSTNQTFNRSPNQAATLSTNQAITQSTSQTVNHESTNRTTTQSTNQATLQATNQAHNPVSSTQSSSSATSPVGSEVTNQGSDQLFTEVGGRFNVAVNPTSISKPQPEADERCVCVVYDINGYNATREMLDTTSELLVDRKSMSSYMRSKTSAPNVKQSSVYLGSTFGVTVFLTAFAVIVLPDLLSLFRHVCRPACRHRGKDVARL